MKITTYYKIVDINNKCYIGKTIQKLKYRIAKHKSKNNNTASKLLDLNKCIVIELLKIIPKDEEHSKNIEKSFIRSCPNCVNIQYKRTLKEQIQIYRKKRYKENNDYFRNSSKKSYNKNKNTKKEYYRKKKEIILQKARKIYDNTKKIENYNKNMYKSIVLSKSFIKKLEFLINKKKKIIYSPYKYKKLPVYKLNFLEKHFRKIIKNNKYRDTYYLNLPI